MFKVLSRPAHNGRPKLLQCECMSRKKVSFWKIWGGCFRTFFLRSLLRSKNTAQTVFFLPLSSGSAHSLASSSPPRSAGEADSIMIWIGAFVAFCQSSFLRGSLHLHVLAASPASTDWRGSSWHQKAERGGGGGSRRQRRLPATRARPPEDEEDEAAAASEDDTRSGRRCSSTSCATAQ